MTSPMVRPKRVTLVESRKKIPLKKGRKGAEFAHIPRILPESTFEALAREAIKICLNEGKNGYMRIVLHQLTKFPKGFPNVGRATRLEGFKVVYEIKATKVLNWLKENGHSIVDPMGLKMATMSLAYEFSRIERMLEDLEL